MDKRGSVGHNYRSVAQGICAPNVRQRAGNGRELANSGWFGAMASILLLNGPNLNLLGMREPALYGDQTLAGLEQQLRDEAGQAGYEFDAFQSNAEHALIERVHAAREDGTAFILVNPAAFTHTSVALRDALAAVAIPFIEIHITNIHAREPFRRQSYFSDLAQGVICGLGTQGYRLALEAAVRHLDSQE